MQNKKHVKSHERLSPFIRKNQIFETTLRLAETIGYHNVTRSAIAIEANVAPNLVSYYFKTMAKLKMTIIQIAIERQILPIIAQVMASRDDTKYIPEYLKRKAAEYLLKK